MVDSTMVVGADWLGKQLEQASPDLLREMVLTFITTLMGAEADAVCGARYGEVSVPPAPTKTEDLARAA